MGSKRNADLTTGNIPIQLIKLALPMIIGMLGMVIFNLTDTFYLGQLGADQLAALSFTFPVVLIINSFVKGVGMGSSAIISKYAGAKDYDQIKRTATDSLFLGLLVSGTVVLIGLLTIEPLFTMLGADGIILAYIEEYMSVWYIGSIMLVIPMIGNEIIRALGDTKIPGLIMGFSALMNIVLDPFLIFGIGPFPELGIRGAAIATVLSRSITAVAAILVLAFREKILDFSKIKLAHLWDSWKKILYIGVPNALVQMSRPLGAGIITGLLASYGSYVVAGFGVATKIEVLALTFPMALMSVMGPFIGQNVGCGLFDRAEKGFKIGELYSLISSTLVAVVLILFAEPIAKLFNSEPDVVNTIVLYMRLVAVSYGFQGILRIGTVALNVLNKPIQASTIILIQTFVLYIPLAILGSNLMGLNGIFVALSVSYLLTAILTHIAIKYYMKKYKEQIAL